jgi:phosphatidylglycerophosphate synthase
MAFDRHLREIKERMLRPAAVRVAGRAHPITISCVALGVGIGAAAAAVLQMYGAGLVLWLLNRTLDGLDGAVARLTGQQSDFGGYVDFLFDVIVYATIPLALTLGHANPGVYAAAGFLIATFYINLASSLYLSSIMEKRQIGATARGEHTAITLPTGLVEGFETIVFYALFFLLPGALVPLFVTMGALVLVTIAGRLRWAARHLT